MSDEKVVLELTQEEMQVLLWLLHQVQYSFTAADVTEEMAEKLAQHLRILAGLRKKLEVVLRGERECPG